MATFATGVTVVTTRWGEAIHGLTVNAFCSVSLEPALVLVCIENQTTARSLLEKSGIFAVNVLAADQEATARRFASSQLSAAERFQGVTYHQERTGAPILDHSLGFLDCRMIAAYPGGDHTIFLGEVQALGQRDLQQPLLYFQSTYRSMHS